MVNSTATLIEDVQNSQDWYIRRKACFDLSRNTDYAEEKIRSLMSVIESENDDNVLQAAILALVRLNAKELGMTIHRPKYLTAENPEIRWAAVYALSYFGTNAHLEPVGKLVNDDDWSVRTEAITTIEKLLDRIIVKADFDQFILLIRLLQVDNDSLRERITNIFIHHKESAITYLEESLNNDNADIRMGILRILGKIGFQNIRDKIIPYTQDPSIKVRIEAIRTLGKIHNATVVNTIIECLADCNKTVVETAVQTILELNQKDPQVKKILLNSVYNIHNSYIRKSIIRIIGLIGDPEMMVVILDHIGDSYFRVRCQAVNSAIQYAQTIQVPLENNMKTNQVSIDVLLEEAQNNDNFRLSVRAIKALGVLRNSKSLEILQKLTQSENQIIAQAALDSYQLVLNSAWSRANGAYVLGEINAETAVGALLDIIDDPSEVVRKSVIMALGKIRNKETTLPICAIAKNDASIPVKIEAVKALGDIGYVTGEIKEILLSLIEDPDQLIRREAARSLRIIDDEDVIDALIKALEDESSTAAQTAVYALYTIGEKTLSKVVKAAQSSSLIQVKINCLNLIGSLKGSDGIGMITDLTNNEVDASVIAHSNNILAQLQRRNDGDFLFFDY